MRTIMVMDKDDYTRKVESYIMENGYQLMDKDQTKEYHTRIKDGLKKNDVIVSERTTIANLIASKFKRLLNPGRKPDP